MKKLLLAAAFAFVALPAAGAQSLPQLVETPSLVNEVASGKLPPVAQRVPQHPEIAQFGKDQQIGRQGGEWKMLMSRTQDVRMMVVYGYSRLVGYDQNFDLKPDILESIDVEGGRKFTMHLRPGHKWSDGTPFTSEDFRYWWQDVIENRNITVIGAPKVLQVDGKGPKVSFPNETTVIYEWDAPNPFFLPALAGPAPLYIYRPARYMKQFHEKYADKDKLAALVQQARARNWAQLHNRMDNQYRNDNPELPTLDPWVIQNKPPADRFVFVRNPYYHRIDAEGRQLPYIDRVVMNIADGRIMPTKVGGGEADLQSRGIAFSNYTFLKQGSKRKDFDVRLWDTAVGAQVAIYPNLNVNDPEIRKLNRDVRFRRALSLAINRHEINQVIYFGLGLEGGNSALPGSPLYNAGYRQAWSSFDLKAANRLLDEIGLTKKDSRGIRLLPDGRPLEIVVETAGEDTQQVDVLELIHDTWLQAGIKIYTKPSERDVFRERVFSGETAMSVWYGVDNALVTANMSPWEFTPSQQIQLQWPKWGQYLETNGKSGEPTDMPEAKELMALDAQWQKALTLEEKTRIWDKILNINAEQVYTLGIVAGVKQPVVVSRTMRNVPTEAVHNWDPGAFFGIYHPDTFWFDTRTTAQAR